MILRKNGNNILKGFYKQFESDIDLFIKEILNYLIECSGWKSLG